MLDVEGLRVTYGAVEAVHGISFSVAKGEVVALIGANGAGKTSTLAALSGLIRPSGGSIRLDGRELVGAPPHRIVAAGVVQVPEGREILARMSVEENLLLGSRGRGGVAALEPVWERFPILRERHALPAGTLSGGEQQMLAIGRALLARGRVLLLDEPSLGLAPKMVATIFDVLADLRRQGTTMLIVEQNALRALRLADRAHVMDLGRLTLSGSGEALLRDQGVVKAYLGG
ncbi:MAG: ABC transporter ATP-binding protein [Chloroflexi bacterium]|nr:MAG: ABC transporter ATP-binding protein [Chloroflexota bacterium]TME43626.1 MAG: ABC transporter ATP-binding protein [Chloroflexota bacterium]